MSMLFRNVEGKKRKENERNVEGSTKEKHLRDLRLVYRGVYV